MSSKTNLFLFASQAAFSILHTSSAQQLSSQNNLTSSCDFDPIFGPDGTAFNGSSSYQVPGFSPEGSTDLPQTLTYNAAVRVTDQGYSAHAVWVELENGTDIGYDGLPYLGCLTALRNFPPSTVRRAQNDNGDCTETFDQDCIDALLEQAQSIVPDADDENVSAVGLCATQEPEEVPQACRRYIQSDNFDSYSFPHVGNHTASNGIDERICHAGNEIRVIDLSIGWGSLYALQNDESADADQGDYDFIINDAFAVLTTVWAKDAIVESNRRWSDTRLICMTAGQNIKTGSRVPDEIMTTPGDSTGSDDSTNPEDDSASPGSPTSSNVPTSSANPASSDGATVTDGPSSSGTKLHAGDLVKGFWLLTAATVLPIMIL
ncbi:MAG: hypothetical protein Q9185_004546 [Variospora sp. 1 TL-2023]